MGGQSPDTRFAAAGRTEFAGKTDTAGQAAVGSRTAGAFPAAFRAGFPAGFPAGFHAGFHASAAGKAAGFGILELLAVLALLFALWLIAVTSVGDLATREVVRRAGRTLGDLVEHKALEAMSRGRAIYLFVEEAAGTIRESSAASGEEGREIYRLPPGLSFAGSHVPR